MAVKITVTVDEATVLRLQRAAARTGQAKNAVIREAIRDYDARVDRLSDKERRRLLRILDDFAASPPTRPQHEVKAELRELRRSRRSAGRLHPQP